jgi:hypothetical protein
MMINTVILRSRLELDATFAVNRCFRQQKPRDMKKIGMLREALAMILVVIGFGGIADVIYERYRPRPHAQVAIALFNLPSDKTMHCTLIREPSGSSTATEPSDNFLTSACNNYGAVWQQDMPADAFSIRRGVVLWFADHPDRPVYTSAIGK